jgi:hypothetical protein
MSKAPNLSKHFWLHLGLFIAFNLLLYLFINKFHDLVRFKSEAYFRNAHHYTIDPRSEGKPFNFFSALAQYDAQWYLKISDANYSFNYDFEETVDKKNDMSNLSYAFFPLLPMLINLSHFVISDLETAAFVTTNLLLLLNFLSLYLMLSKLSNRNTAVKTIWLLMLFPFSIFFRSYFGENLQLLLSIWFLFFLIKNQYYAASIFLGFLGLTKGIVLPIGLLFAILMTGKLLKKQISLKTYLISALISSLGILSWIGFNYLETGDFLYFQKVQSAWYFEFPVPPPIYNLILIINMPLLPFHTIHASFVDVVICLLSLWLIVWSYKKLPLYLWLYSLMLWILPFFTRDLASFSRYQSASFPLFYALAKHLSGWRYYFLLIISGILLFITSAFFVNWYWIG